MSFSGFADAYRYGLQTLLVAGEVVPSVKDPISVASHFGVGDRPSIELLGHSFEILNSGPSLLFTSARPFNLGYMFGLFLWTLAGSDSVDWLKYYNASASDYSSDDVHLCGSFGRRLFRAGDDFDQIDALVSRLVMDPASRRAFAPIIVPADNDFPLRDYPCAIGIQFFRRHDRLDMVLYMRAQNAISVLPYDYFIFSALHAYVASRMSLRCGRYIHVSGTYHIYQADIDNAQRILASQILDVTAGKMPDSGEEFLNLFEFEASLRDLDGSLSQADLSRFADSDVGRSGFVQNAKLSLLAHAAKRANLDLRPLFEIYTENPEFQALARHHWGIT